MNIGAPELLIILISFAPLALVIWGVVDAASRPDRAWEQSGQNRVLWIVLMVAGLFVCYLGAIAALVYLLAIRPQVARHQGGPPQVPPPPGPPYG